MRVLMAAVMPLLMTLLGGPDPEPPPGAPLDLGMGPRPTLQCGGQKRMEKWDRERSLRLDERANKALSRFVHATGSRLGENEYDERRASWRAAQTKWASCVGGLPRLDAVCVAVAARRPELCVYALGGEDAGRCVELADAARVLERGGPVPPVEESLTPEACARGGLLLSAFSGGAARCARVLWSEAIRSNDPGWCDGLAEPSQRQACLAVYTASPELCPGPVMEADGVLLDRVCRDATLDPGWPPETIPEGGAARLRFAVLNAFTLPARCVARVSVGQDVAIEVAMTATFPVVPAEASETVAVTPVEATLSRYLGPADVDIDVTCTWALEEPGHGKEFGVMGLIAW